MALSTGAAEGLEDVVGDGVDSDAGTAERQKDENDRDRTGAVAAAGDKEAYSFRGIAGKWEIGLIVDVFNDDRIATGDVYDLFAWRIRLAIPVWAVVITCVVQREFTIPDRLLSKSSMRKPYTSRWGLLCTM